MKQNQPCTAIVRAILWLAVIAEPLCAQDPDPRPGHTPPCVRPELEHIAFLEGSWDVISRQRANLTEDRWKESRGQSTWKPIVAGCAMQEHWSGIVDGQQIEWIQLLAFDGREQRWQQVMLDSAHGNVITAEGHVENGRLILNVPHLRRGELLIDRTTIEEMDPESVMWTVETSLDGGKTWAVFWTLRYSRR